MRVGGRGGREATVQVQVNAEAPAGLIFFRDAGQFQNCPIETRAARTPAGAVGLSRRRAESLRAAGPSHRDWHSGLDVTSHRASDSGSDCGQCPGPAAAKAECRVGPSRTEPADSDSAGRAAILVVRMSH